MSFVDYGVVWLQKEGRYSGEANTAHDCMMVVAIAAAAKSRHVLFPVLLGRLNRLYEVLCSACEVSM